MDYCFQPKQLASQQANGTFSEVFDVDGWLSTNPVLAAVVWWLAVILLGWLAFPLAYVVFRGLPDRGYALARILSLLVVSYLAWLSASLGWLPFYAAQRSYWLSVFGVGQRRHLLAPPARNSHNSCAKIGGFSPHLKLIGILLYLLQIGIRLGNPDVWDVIWGGEKPMDLSYFTAVLKSTTFPPYDPWYAGGYINYYYYGFVFAGVLAKLLGIVPALAYNLILPMLYSFTGLGVFSIAYNLVAYGRQKLRDGRSGADSGSIDSQGMWAGFTGLVLAILVGNLAEVGVLLDAWFRAGSEVLGQFTAYSAAWQEQPMAPSKC